MAKILPYLLYQELCNTHSLPQPAGGPVVCTDCGHQSAGYQRRQRNQRKRGWVKQRAWDGACGRQIHNVVAHANLAPQSLTDGPVDQVMHLHRDCGGQIQNVVGHTSPILSRYPLRTKSCISTGVVVGRSTMWSHMPVQSCPTISY